MSTRRCVWWPAIVILFVSAIVSIHGLNQDALWGDEIFTVYDSGAWVYGPLTPAEIWNRVGTENQWHVPLFFVAIGYWARVVGSSALALRALSVWFSLLAIAWVYRLGRAIISPSVGWLAALLLGTSGFYVYYTHELRMYSLVVLLTTMLTYAYFRGMYSKQRLSPLVWSMLFVGVSGLLYTHYFGALVVAGIGLYHLLFGRRSRHWWRITIIGFVGLLTFLPWLPMLALSLQATAEAEKLHQQALHAGALLLQFATIYGNGSWILTITGLAAGIMAGWHVPAFRRFSLITLTITIWLVAGNEILQVVRADRLRYLLVLFPLIAIMIAVAIVSWMSGKKRWRQAAGLILLTSWLISGLWNSVNLDGLKSATWLNFRFIFPLHTLAQNLSKYVGPDDLIITYLPDDTKTLTYDINDSITAFYFYGIPVHTYTPHMAGDAIHQQGEIGYVANLARLRTRVWIAYIPQFAAVHLDTLRALLTDTFRACGSDVQGSTLSVELYVRPSEACFSF